MKWLIVFFIVGCSDYKTQCIGNIYYECFSKGSDCRIIYESLVKVKPVKCVKREK